MVSRSRIEDVLAVLAVILLSFVLNWNILISKELMATHDTLRGYSLYAYFADNLLNGHIPLWNPYVNAGEPFFPTIDVKQYWLPINILSVAFIWITGADLFSAYHYMLFAYYMVFVAGCYAFFRQISHNKISAVIALIVISMSVLQFAYLRHSGFIEFIYLMPWTLVCIFKVAMDKRYGYLIPAAVLFGLYLTYPHSMFTFLFIAIFISSLCVARVIPLSGFFGALRRPRALVISLLVLAATAFRTVPLYLYKGNLVPTILTEVPNKAYSWWGDFFTLFAPYLNVLYKTISDSFMYMGLAGLFLAFTGAFFSESRYRLPLLITIIATMSLMAGDNFFIYPFLNKYAPFFSLFRNTHLFSPFFMFSVACLVCIGSDFYLDMVYRSIKIPAAKAYTAVTAVLVIAVISVFLFLYYHSLFPMDISISSMRKNTALSLFNILFFAIGAVLVISIMRSGRIRPGFKSFVVIVFILADLVYFSISIMPVFTDPRHVWYLPKHPTGYSFAEKRKAFLTAPDKFGFLWPSVVKDPVAYMPYSDYGSHFFETNDFYNFMESSLDASVKTAWAGVSRPRLRLFKTALVVKDPLISLGKMDKTALQESVFIEEELAARFKRLQTNELVLQEPAEGKIKVEGFSPNRLKIEVSAATDSILYYSDGYDKNWRVYIDGKKDRIYKANLAFKAAAVPSGRHIVEFVYWPWLYMLGLYSYFATLACFILYGAFRAGKMLFK
ncbi:MAG: YfhO family protein [Deltaproteobacteria bacterium]|nr:YfhO family protein [Deltaproteobacteria bacterium]